MNRKWARRARCPHCWHRFPVGRGAMPTVGRTLLTCGSCQRVVPYEPEPPDERWWAAALAEVEG